MEKLNKKPATFAEQFFAGLNIIKENNNIGESRFITMFCFTLTKRSKTIYIGLITNKGQYYRTWKTYNNLDTALAYVNKGQWSYISWDKRAKKNNITTKAI